MNFENIMLSYSNQIETAARCMIHVYEMYRISKDVDTEKISGFGDWGKGNGGLGFFCCSVTNLCRPSLRFHGLQHSSLPCPSTITQILLKCMSMEPVMPSNHLILCRPLLLLPSVFPSIRVFSNESTLPIRRPNFGASASVLPMNIQG